MTTQASRIPLMLIHGAWLSSRSWEQFDEYFTRRGFAVSAPEWPRKHGDVEELRESADELAGLGLDEIVDHYAALIEQLDQPPVLIGHSFGGMVVELLLSRGIGRAGVALSPAPPKGLKVLPFSALKSVSPALAHPSKRHGVVELTLEQFTYGFVNTLEPEAAKAAYERYAVPETGMVFYEAGLANFKRHASTDVHFEKDDRAPLLIVGADADHTVPASVSRKQYEKYQASSAQTDYIEFEGRPHLFTVGEGADEVAEAVDAWIAGVITPSRASAGTVNA